MCDGRIGAARQWAGHLGRNRSAPRRTATRNRPRRAAGPGEGLSGWSTCEAGAGYPPDAVTDERSRGARFASINQCSASHDPKSAGIRPSEPHGGGPSPHVHPADLRRHPARRLRGPRFDPAGHRGVTFSLSAKQPDRTAHTGPVNRPLISPVRPPEDSLLEAGFRVPRCSSWIRLSGW